MNDKDIHVIGFITRDIFKLRNPPEPEINPDNIVKGYFYSMSAKRPTQKTIGDFIKISYLTNNGLSSNGYFFLECLVDNGDNMPSQFICDNKEFEVIFNGKRYEYKDLNQLYIDYINYNTVNAINSLP